MQKAITDQKVLYCDSVKCAGKNYPVKPNIVFFGESLPHEFLKIMMEGTMKQADLLIVIGTALAVSPFNALVGMVSASCPKVLMNLENTKDTGGYDFLEPGTTKLFIKGKCDETVAQLCKDCGWQEDFEKVLPAYHAGKHIPPAKQ